MDNETLPSGTAELLKRIQHGWDDMWAAIDGLTLAQMEMPDAGGWSIKDSLAHMTTWERFMLRHYLLGQPAGEAFGIDEAITQSHYDEINAAIFERNRGRVLDDVLTDAATTHQQVVDYLSAVPFERLMRQKDADDPEKRPVLAWVAGNTFGHYEEHMDAIQALAGGVS